MALKQFKTGHDNFTYLIFCEKTKKAAIVDPSYDAIQTIDFISKNSLSLEYIILTHYHSDHICKTLEIKKIHLRSKIVTSEQDGSKLGFNVDRYISDHEHINLGNIALEFLLTSGHTKGGICIIVEDKYLLTGDTLFIGNCGRTDLSGGNIQDMFNTLNEKIKTLSNHLIVYPGHDYGDKPYDTLGNQKKTNITLLAKTIEEFYKIP